MAGTGPVRLNVGAGRHILDGWINIDAVRSARASRDPDILCDVRNIPLPNACADELHAVHLFEHFYRWEIEDLLEEWKRLLKPRGLLVLEMPDLLKCAQAIIDGKEDRFGYWGLYGDPGHKDPYMCHRWGWTPDTLRAVLEAHGFVKVKQELPQWHRKYAETRDMRMTACAP